MLIRNGVISVHDSDHPWSDKGFLHFWSLSRQLLRTLWFECGGRSACTYIKITRLFPWIGKKLFHLINVHKHVHITVCGYSYKCLDKASHEGIMSSSCCMRDQILSPIRESISLCLV